MSTLEEESNTAKEHLYGAVADMEADHLTKKEMALAMGAVGLELLGEHYSGRHA